MPGEHDCPNCSKRILAHMTSCSFECTVAMARKAGGKTFAPNGLPIRCVRLDGAMYEHEHGDHPTYICPVNIEYCGSNQETLAGYDEREQTHALIYSDGCVALTMFEYCYAIWALREGELLGGSLWKRGEWRMTKESAEDVRTRFPRSEVA